MTVTPLRKKIDLTQLVQIAVSGGDLVGEVKHTHPKKRGRNKFLTKEQIRDLRFILKMKNKPDLFAQTKNFKFEHDPQHMTSHITDADDPKQTLSIWFSSRKKYFRLRCRYLGIPYCCAEHHGRVPPEQRAAEKDLCAPIGICRCPIHASLSTEEYLGLVNAERYHPIPQSLKGGIPFPRDFFLRLTSLVLRGEIKG